MKISQGTDFQLPDDRSIFERTLEALPDGVLLTDAGRNVVYANHAFAEHWRIPEPLLERRDDLAILRFVADQLIDPEAFRREVERLNPSDESTEDEIRFKDGRIFARRSVPFARQGSVQARVWIFTDVTEARNSTIDALTGLGNRRAYSRYFPDFATAPDDGLLRLVAILDVDNFKAFNDRYGHAAGDAVLGEIGSIVQSRFRDQDDAAFRIGGEEFLMASKSRSEAAALATVERLRQSIAAMATAHLGNPPHGIVTVSIGLCTFRGPGEAGKVFEHADRALYAAKAAGRNATVALACGAATA